MSNLARAWLGPLVPLYRLGLALRERRLTSGSEPVERLQWPVISIGNLSTGGAGKTPLTIALARALTVRGAHVDVLSRGYGRAGQGTEQVQKEGSAERYGDEPLLIAREADVSVYVAARRVEAGRVAEAEHETDGLAVHLLDDGFQHRQLHRDVDVLLLNLRDWRDGLLPAGNLREEIGAAKRAGVIAIPAEEAELEGELREWGWSGPVWKLHRRMDVLALDGEVVAFCGIARPEQFFLGLEQAGVQIAERIVFRDHHRYTQSDWQRLDNALRRTQARTLLTTEKDRVRLGTLADTLPLRTVPLRTEIEDEAAALEWLMGRIRSSRHS